MTSQLAPIVTAVPFIGIDSSGRPVRPHPNFLRWWAAEVAQRVGGITAPTNIELQQSVTVIEGDTTILQDQFDTMPPAVPFIPSDSDEPPGVADLRARLAVLELLVAQLREGPTP